MVVAMLLKKRLDNKFLGTESYLVEVGVQLHSQIQPKNLHGAANAAALGWYNILDVNGRPDWHNWAPEQD